MNKLILPLLLLFLSIFSLQGQQINEIDIDHPGVDNAEFIEFFLPTSATLSDYRVTLYGGSNGKMYNSFTLDVSDVTCTVEGVVQFCVWDPPGNNQIQNGAPDGIALYQISTSTLIEFLSYGGSFTATDGDAAGATSTDIGVIESNTTAANMSLQREEGGNLWFGPSEMTPGEVNLLALPVELVHFEGKPLENNSIMLFWSTQSEKDNSHFSIYHSRDGIDFVEIGKESGHGTSSIAHNYSFTHERQKEGIHYYQLKQVDFNGDFEYSEIISTRIETPLLDISMSSNPTPDKVTVFINTNIYNKAIYQVVNMNKYLLIDETLPKGETSFEVDLSDFPDGIYFLRLFVDKEVLTKKIVKFE